MNVGLKQPVRMVNACPLLVVVMVIAIKTMVKTVKTARLTVVVQ